jgi:hypothetical protein
MRHLTRTLLILVAAFGLATKAPAFSLMGPFASWQATAIGYNLAGDIGGPMNLGEEYRLTVPVLTYGFDATFLNFFGSNGVVAINSAMAILNTIPAASAMSANLAEFPVQAIGPQNATAANLRVRDLKSAAMSTVLGHLGLASPERWTYALRDRVVVGGRTNYLVIQRNFDAVSWAPTNVVNGVLYTYTIQDPIPTPNYADAVETRVSGNINNVSVASVDDGGGLLAGQFFTGLTRDDYGALRYLLRFNNVNVETLDASVRLAGVASPYGPVTGTNTTNLVGTNVAVATARRPGIDQISFSGMAVDALLNLAITPVTNRYTDQYYLTNALVLTNQVVQRVTTIPDILFTAADLVAGGTLADFRGDDLTRPVTSRWVNNSTLNTIGGVGGGIVAGPGVIPPAGSNATAIVITFNTLGPSRLNFSDARDRFLDERNYRTNGVWGFFDTTTIFSVFPDGLTIQDLERQLYGR